MLALLNCGLKKPKILTLAKLESENLDIYSENVTQND